MNPSRHFQAPSIPCLLAIVAALTVQLASVTPVHAQASIDCFKVCSTLFYKHVGAIMKCAHKGRADEAVATECAAKAAAKMHKNYVLKLQSKCGDAACVSAYPATNDFGCETQVFSTATSGQVLFGGSAVPLDTLTRDRIITAGTTGCGY